MPEQPKGPEQLVRAVPDSEGDRETLRKLRDSSGAPAQELAERLLADEAWRILPLRELLPGLSLNDVPNFSIRLSVRTANPLLRAGAGSLRALAALAPAEILALSGIGKKSAEEILRAAVSEWALIYLGQEGGDREAPLPAADEALARDDLGGQQRLSDAFARIEQTTGFEAFRHRKLIPVARSQSAVAAELGITPEQAARYEKTIGEKLARQMRDTGSAFSVAATALQNRLGVLTRLYDFEQALAAIDPLERVMPENLPQRRVLLLWLAGFRLTDEWVVDVEIDEIVDALLKGLTEAGPADLDAVDRLLARLQVRKDLRLAWIVHHSVYRIVDQKLVRVDERR